MAWTAPMTAVANAFFTATQFNTYVRDNLNATAPASASAAGSYWVGSGDHTLVERAPTAQTVATAQNTTSTSFTNLSTTGPVVTVTTGTRALICIAAFIQNDTDFAQSSTAVAVTGSSSVSASSDNMLSIDGIQGGSTNGCRVGLCYIQNLTAGSNTFTMKYKTGGLGTGTFTDRHLVVLPL